MPTEKPRYTIIVDDEMMQRIDDFRFENRYPSRSAATVELIRIGLDSFIKNAPVSSSDAEAFICNDSALHAENQQE